MLERTRNTIVGASLLGGAMAFSAPAAHTADMTTMSGNVSSWVATATKTGTAPGNQVVAIALYMKLKNIDGLKQLVAAVSTPGAASYGQYLTPSSFRSRFAPEAADVAAVSSLLTSAGMTDVQVGADGAYVSAHATVAQLRSSFAVSQDLYTLGGVTLRANKEAPRLPAALAGKVTYIEGLDDTNSLRRPNHVSVTEGLRVAPAMPGASFVGASGLDANSLDANGLGTGVQAAAAVTPPPVAASLPSPYCDTYYGDLTATLSNPAGPYGRKLPWLNCGYTPQQIRAAYGLNRVKPDGNGVHIAIIDAYASPTLQADANRYARNHHLPALTSANFQQDIPLGIYDVSPNESCGPYGWWGEQSLDVAAVHGSAPGANILYIGARDCGTSLTIALVDAIYNVKADIITNSYGNNGEYVTAADVAMEDQAFLAAAAQGITVLFSSGDDGDLSQINGVASGSYEATSPYVTGVGGTTLGVMAASGRKSEYGWGNYRDYLAGAMVNSGNSVSTAGLTSTTAFGSTFYDFGFYAGSGGGISLIEPQPSYQAGVVPAALATTLYTAAGEVIPLSSPQRVTPDVSMVGDPYTGYLYGETFTIAGNSASDAGCKAISSTTEYCETAIGGTSLASPLMAGMLAVVDQSRKAAGKAVVGFANPWLYAARIGKSTGFDAAGINDIVAPTTPTALLRGYVTNPTQIRVVTVNSVPFLIDSTPFPLQVCATAICEGIDDVFNQVTPGYDDVTGLGVPWAPSLVKQ